MRLRVLDADAYEEDEEERTSVRINTKHFLTGTPEALDALSRAAGIAAREEAARLTAETATKFIAEGCPQCGETLSLSGSSVSCYKHNGGCGWTYKDKSHLRERAVADAYRKSWG